MGVLGELAADYLIEVDDGDRDVRPTQRLTRREPASPDDQRAGRRDDYGVEQADLGDAARQRFDVSQIPAMPVSDRDGRDGAPHGRLVGLMGGQMQIHSTSTL